MTEKRVERRLAAILAADVIGYSRLTSADEEGTVSRLRALRQELIDPLVAAHGGRIVKNTGDGRLIEFTSVVDAVRCALEVQRGMTARNANVAPEKRIEFRVGIHLGDVMVESDGDLMGDGVNIAARLEGIAEPGGICLSEDSWRQVRDKISMEFADLGEQSLKNIARPVRVYRIEPKAPSAAMAQETAKASLALPEKPSIAVLPFQNMSGDSEQEYFADGIVEDIITALSRFRQFFVIARNSSFTYKGRNADVRTVGRELGVRYVLEGSVRKGGNRLRITTQLVEAATGNHLWADRYDGALEEVFDLQDKITESVVAAVDPSVQKAEIERARTKRPENLDAYDLYLRALPIYWTFTVDRTPKALELLDEALRIDPNYVAAHALATICNAQFYVRDRRDTVHRDEALRHAHAVMSSNSDDANAYASVGWALGFMAHDLDGGLAALDRALVLNPNAAQALGYSACLNSFAGRLDTAITRAHQSLRLNPFDPVRWNVLVALSRCQFLKGQYDEAAATAQQAVRAGANQAASWGYIWLAASYVRLGKATEAREAAQHLLELQPSFRCVTWPGIINSPQAHREAVISALREAGIAE